MEYGQWIQAPCESSGCVQVMKGGAWIYVRASADPETMIRFTPGEWEIFIDAAKQGSFDL